jgi:hypothetical protein
MAGFLSHDVPNRRAPLAASLSEGSAMTERDIFLALVDLSDPVAQAAYLDTACAGSAALRAGVEALLRSHENAGIFLAHPAVAPADPDEETSLVPGSDGPAASAPSGPGVEQTVMYSDAGQGVLHALGQKLVDVPRVILRDEHADGAEPVVAALSREMPPGKSDSRYQLRGEIARGGMGAILKGRDTDLGRDIALKVLLDVHKDKPDVNQRFIEEARIGGQLQHPGIVPVYELGRFADGRPFISMKLVKGQTLSSLLAERADPAAERARFLGIFQQLCQTLAYAHSRGVIHRDLKPSNIMVGAFGEVQVMDWGLAKVLEAGGVADETKSLRQQQDETVIRTLRQEPGSTPVVGSHTVAGAVMGTPAYMAPEQALAEVDRLDERADVFGLGAILCEVLTGKPPYTGKHAMEVYRHAARGRLDEPGPPPVLWGRAGPGGAGEGLPGPGARGAAPACGRGGRPRRGLPGVGGIAPADRRDRARHRGGAGRGSPAHGCRGRSQDARRTPGAPVAAGTGRGDPGPDHARRHRGALDRHVPGPVEAGRSDRPAARGDRKEACRRHAVRHASLPRTAGRRTRRRRRSRPVVRGRRGACPGRRGPAAARR